MDSGNKLKKQKKAPWSLAESKQGYTPGGERGGEKARACSREKERQHA